MQPQPGIGPDRAEHAKVAARFGTPQAWEASMRWGRAATAAQPITPGTDAPALPGRPRQAETVPPAASCQKDQQPWLPP